MAEQSSKSGWIKSGLTYVGSAVTGGVIVYLGQEAELKLVPATMTFEQWAGILLASVAILITTLGVVVAIAAIWGFSGIKTGAEVAAVNHVSQSLEGGSLGDRLDARFTDFLNSRLDKGKFRELLERKVDAILYEGPQARAEGNFGDDDDVDWIDADDMGMVDSDDADLTDNEQSQPMSEPGPVASASATTVDEAPRDDRS